MSFHLEMVVRFRAGHLGAPGCFIGKVLGLRSKSCLRATTLEVFVFGRVSAPGGMEPFSSHLFADHAIPVGWLCTKLTCLEPLLNRL